MVRTGLDNARNAQPESAYYPLRVRNPVTYASHFLLLYLVNPSKTAVHPVTGRPLQDSRESGSEGIARLTHPVLPNTRSGGAPTCDYYWPTTIHVEWLWSWCRCTSVLA